MWVLIVVGTWVCSSCAEVVETTDLHPEAAQPEDHAPVIRRLPSQSLGARERKQAGALSAERVLLVKIHDRNGSPVSYATVLCVGTKLGGLTDERGWACVHGMQSDSLTFKALIAGCDPFLVEMSVKVGEPVVYDFGVVRGPGRWAEP